MLAMLKLGVIGLTIFLFFGCAVTLESVEQQQSIEKNRLNAQKALRDAKDAGAETFATAEFTAANASLAKAKQLLLDNRPDRALQLLQLSIAQAELAKAISEAEQTY